MKTKNQKLKPFIAGSLLAVAVAAIPFVGLAKDSNKYDKEYKGKAKVEVSAEHSNSIWNRLFNNGWFGGSLRARAATNAKLTAQTTPNISGITAPTMLKTGQTGTWTVNASDPQNGSLTYSADWGDTSNMTNMAMIAKAPVFTQTATSSAGATVNYTLPGVVDNADGEDTATCAPASGTVFPIGTTTVKCNYTDSSGNAATETSFTVTVNPQA